MYRFPRFERQTLANGLRVIVAPLSTLPVVSAMAVVEAGASCDPGGAEGLGDLVARGLIEGTERSDGEELASRLEKLGGWVDPAADWDYVSALVTVMPERTSAALDILAEVLTNPSFPDREMNRLKAERQAEILQQRAEPRGLADEMFSRFLYVSGSRYGEPEGGSASSVAGITREQVARFHQEWYRPGRTTIVIVGDVGVEEGIRIVEGTIGSWGGVVPPVPRVDDRPRQQNRAVQLVAKRDAPQSEVRIGHVGVPRSHPDYFRLVVMNAILGGLFSSRINLNLREKHGYTYGAFSQYDWRRHAGPFVVSTAVKSSVTADALREILREVEGMRNAEPTLDELSLVTSYLDGVFPIRYETTSAIAGALAGMVVYDLPDDYFDRYRAHIRAVTCADVLAAAREHLHPDRMQVTVVGDREDIRGPLQSLGWGDVAVYDSEGQPAR